MLIRNDYLNFPTKLYKAFITPILEMITLRSSVVL